MNRPTPAVPTARRDQRELCVNSLMGIKERTGVTMPVDILLGMAFQSGYEAGAEDAGSGELLAEADALQYAFLDLDGKQRRAIALDNLVMAVSLETIEHPEGCSCGLCRALETALGGGISWTSIRLR
jgi:hypothetical protein